MQRIAALMVTQAGRLDLARQAIADFQAQSWADKVLVVVHDGPADYHRQLEAALDRDPGGGDQVLVDWWAEARGAAPLGALRNRAIATAVRRFDPDLVVQWDDDDRYHPERLAIQAAPLAAEAACAGSCLTDQLYRFLRHRTLYWVDWRNRRPRFQSILIPGTILARTALAARTAYPETGAAARRGEDGAFLQRLLSHGPVVPISDNGWCYLRQYHGRNTWEAERFQGNASWLGRPAAALAADQALLRARLAEYPDPPLGPLGVWGRDALAFFVPGGA